MHEKWVSFLDPYSKKWGLIDSLTPCFRALCASIYMPTKAVVSGPKCDTYECSTRIVRGYDELALARQRIIGLSYRKLVS